MHTKVYVLFKIKKRPRKKPSKITKAMMLNDKFIIVYLYCIFVLHAGLEPASNKQKILNLSCLPISPMKQC